MIGCSSSASWRPRPLVLLGALLLCVVMAGCAGAPGPPPSPEASPESLWGLTPGSREARSQERARQAESPKLPTPGTSTRRVSDDVATAPSGRRAVPAPGPGQRPARAEGDLTRVVSFQKAPLAEVVGVLADLMGINVALPSDLKGEVTLHSGGEVKEDELFALLETVLELNNYALARDKGMYRVIPMAEAKFSPAVPQVAPLKSTGGKDGFGVEVYYLYYMEANEALKNLRRFLSKYGNMTAVQPANALVVAETRGNLEKLRRLIEMLDVPFTKRVGIRIYHVENVPAENLAKDLRKMVAAMGISQKPSAGVWLEVVPLVDLDSLAIISPVREMFDRVEQWLGDLDRQLSEAEEGVYVYQCQSGDANTIANVLTSLYGAETDKKGKGGTKTTTTKPKSAPKPVQRLRPTNPTSATGTGEQDTTRTQATTSPEELESVSAHLEGGVRIVVEPNTNSIIIRAPRRRYESLLRTIRKLDIFPRQVLIEVVIAEVQLDDSLEMGVEWDFSSTLKDNTNFGSSLTPAADLIPGSGLIYSITRADKVKASLRALARDEKVNIISAPLLLSSENQESRINVGAEVPIITDVTTSEDLTTDTGRKVTDRSIQYRDTGISLSVTPRINDSGLVKMQIAQEISDVSETAFGSTESPSFTKRSAVTNVITTDSQSVVLAGLIQTKYTDVDAGIPFLKDIPLLGYLFKSTKRVKSRTELIITLTPYVIYDMADAKSIVRELKLEMERIRRPSIRQKKSAPAQGPATPAPAKAPSPADPLAGEPMRD